jgi:hypothetical protein
MAISSANKLSIYNGALTFIGERQLNSTTGLTENIESRYLLDGVWDRGGIDKCLEQGMWKFATRVSQLTYEAGITPAFGYNRAFEKPSDYIRLYALCSDEYFNAPLLDYTEESGYWFTSLDEIYVKYVSNDGSYGTDYSLWPPSFKKFVESWFGCEIIFKLTQNDSKEEMKKKELGKILLEAKSNDAMNGPTVFPPPGRFRMSRRSSYSRGDVGSRSRLIG